MFLSDKVENSYTYFYNLIEQYPKNKNVFNKLKGSNTNNNVFNMLNNELQYNSLSIKHNKNKKFIKQKGKK